MLDPYSPDKSASRLVMDPRPSPDSPTLAVAGGYSSGHVIPGLALASWAHENLPGWRVHFFGSEDGPEGAWIRDHGYAFTPLPVLPVRGRAPKQRLRAAIRFLDSAREAARLYRRMGVRAVVSLGSYGAVAPILAAQATGRPLLVFEPNAGPGLATRLASLRCDRCFVTPLWQGKRRGVVMARLPLAPSLLEAPQRTVPRGRPLRLLVLAGSLGFDFLNRRVPELVQEMGRLGRQVEVRHQTGIGMQAAEVRQSYGDAPVEVAPFWKDMAPHYRWADLAITAAGSVTLHELAAQYLPAIVVPLLGAADDHQTQNALSFAALTGADVVELAAWDTAGVLQRLERLVDDPAAWRARWEGCRRFHAAASPEPWEMRLRRLHGGSRTIGG